MLTQLYYPSGTTFSTIVDDLVKAMTGVTDLAQFSTSLDRTDSSLVATKRQSNWELISRLTPTTTTAPITDLSTTNFPVKTLAGAILRQPCSTDPTQFKYLKFAFVAHDTSQSTTKDAVYLWANIGTGVSGSTLTGSMGADYLYQRSEGLVHCRFLTKSSTNLNIILNACRISLSSSPAATLMSIAETDLFNEKPAFAIFDYPKNWYAQFVPTMINCMAVDQRINIGRKLKGGTYATLPVTIDEVTYGGPAMSTAFYSKAVIGSFEYPFELIDTTVDELFMLSDRKFAGFKPVGNGYDMLSFGVHMMEIRTTTVGRLETISFASITDISGVYLINMYAFGKNGEIFDTPAGLACKFGHYMVEVG